MRVIEERHIHDKEAFCTHCGTILGYYPADVQIGGTSKIRDIDIWIKCPVCGKRIILNTFSLEDYWQWEKDFKKWKDGV